MFRPWPNRTPFHVLAKPTGAACNLDCTYCFFLSKELLYDRASQLMTEEGLKDYLQALFFSQPDGPVEIAWQGGEPTMRGLDFFRLAVDLADKIRRPAQLVTHSIQTNGTLLTNEWGAFLAANDFLVGLSIDGPTELHDAYRMNKAGRGSHFQTIRGWEILQKYQVRTNILCTVHAANQNYGTEVYKYFRDVLEAKYLQFIPIVERVSENLLPLAESGWGGKNRVLYRQTGNHVTSRSVTPKGWGHFLIDVYDQWYPRDVGSVFIQHVETAVGNAIGQYGLCVHSPTCGTSLATEFNGDVYSCDHFVEPEYLLGNIKEKSYIEMLSDPRQEQFGEDKQSKLPDQCLRCPVLWACQGGCPKDRFVLTESGQEINYLCHGYQEFFRHIQDDILQIAFLLRQGKPIT